jgi:hypothetical protein
MCSSHSALPGACALAGSGDPIMAAIAHTRTLQLVRLRGTK